MKPALEPILVFQKPYQGRPIDNIVSTGAGALNIAKGQIPVAGKDTRHPIRRSDIGFNRGGSPTEYDPTHGRWPANFFLVHHPNCADGECHPDCPVRRLNEQTGILTSGKPSGVRKADNNGIYGSIKKSTLGTPVTGIGDSGGAARFFFNADWNAEVEERIFEADPVFYTGKAKRAEREAGLEDRETEVVGDRRWPPIANPYQRGQTERKNIHPTVKPISLTRWLASLLLPPAAYAPRRLLVPFAGVGSEMIGAMQAGWDCVIGVEGQQEYVDIARQRLAHWEAKRQPRLFD